MLVPQWTSAFDPVIAHGRGVNEYAALQLTDRALNALRRATELRGELRALHSLYPELGALLSGRALLQAMGPLPGAAVPEHLYIVTHDTSRATTVHRGRFGPTDPSSSAQASWDRGDHPAVGHADSSGAFSRGGRALAPPRSGSTTA